MALYNKRQAALEAFLKGVGNGESGAKTAMDSQEKQDQETQKAVISTQGEKRQLNTAKDFSKQNPLVGIDVSDKGVKIDPKALAQGENKQEGRDDKYAADYSKRLEKMNDFRSALDDVERITNRDGSGGVLTNKNAKPVSVGKMLSKVPTQAIGIGELLSPELKGASDERKAMERLILQYQKATSGMRTSNETREAERQALGFMASGDPDLVSKGIRSLARSGKNAYNTIAAGYDPRVQAKVHGQLGGDPRDYFNSVYNDDPEPSAPPAGPSKAPGSPATPPAGGGMGGMPGQDAIAAEMARRQKLKAPKGLGQ
jgi:hypothetical protein